LLTFDFLRGVNAKEQFAVPNGTTTTTKKPLKVVIPFD
jgi:hypothetical protein